MYALLNVKPTRSLFRKARTVLVNTLEGPKKLSVSKKLSLGTPPVISVKIWSHGTKNAVVKFDGEYFTVDKSEFQEFNCKRRV